MLIIFKMAAQYCNGITRHEPNSDLLGILVQFLINPVPSSLAGPAARQRTKHRTQGRLVSRLLLSM